MKVKESAFWRWLKKKFDELGVLYDRIEPTVPGTPDINAIYNHKEVWIELKSESGEGINIKPWQTRWAIRREEAGSQPFLLVKRKTSKYDQLELYTIRNKNWVLCVVIPKISAGYNTSELIDYIFIRRY